VEETLLPLFPLEVVLLPEELLPLHIFEERYKQMIAECLEAKSKGLGYKEFGVVQAKEQQMHKVGCSARIVNVTRKYADGRMDILTIGARRFEVLFTDEEKPYLRGGVEFYEDEIGHETPVLAEAQRAIELFRRIMQRWRKSSDIPIHLPAPYRHLSFRIAAPLPLHLDFKQALLSIRDESDRLRRVMREVELLSAQLDLVTKARGKTGGNGNVHL